MNIINKIKHIVIGVACLLLVGIMIVGDFVCKEFYGDISTRLGQRTWTTEEVGDDDGYDATHYTSEYNYNIKEIRKAQEKLATDIQQEGSVILKMGALPMAKTANITLLGAASASGFLYAGSGSGAISSAAMPTLKSVFEDAGYKVNEAMWTYYSTGAGKSRQSANGRRVGESGAPAQGSAAANSVSAYKDYGIVVIGRAGAEATDIPFTTVEDENKHFLELSANEVSLIDYAIANFDNTIILLNTMQPVELSPVLNKNVAIVWIGAAGEKGVKAVPGILNGTLNPSGRLVDTYATKLMNAPSVANQGNFQITNLWSSVNGSRSGNYYVYAEGIYVGYRYYETRYADKVENRAKVGEFNYNDEVDFPFGYGLSYSTFEYSDFDIAEGRDKLTAKVTVKNTSEVAGKEVVQIYMQSPYTDFDAQNGIEKSAVELVGFAKTEEIAPGASVTVNVEIPKEYMRVYDSVVNKTYIVEQGDYYFAVGKDSHDALNNILAKRSFKKSDGMTDDGDANAVDVVKVSELDTKTYSTGEDGKKIENEFANDTINAYDSTFKYLTRSDWTGTMPRPYGGENADATYKGKITAGEKMLADENVPDPVINSSDEMPLTGQKNGLVLADMFGLDYDHELWSKLLDQLSIEDLKTLLTARYGNAKIESINKPYFVDSDGPQGITSSAGGTATGFGYPIELLVASTWNLEIAERQGKLIGEDSLVTLVPGWYAPACNIHRSAFSGRNFEYYSEDPLMSGKFSGTVIQEAWKKGLYCYLKHFALNDQETNRNTASTFANEQAIRQIYLKPFEVAIRDYGANALMLSMNRIGMTWSGHHVNLLQKVVRGEWGFVGVVNTDASGRFATDINDSAVYAGTDCFLNAQTVNDDEIKSATMVKALREAAHRLLYVTGNSNGMNGIKPNTVIKNLTPAWVYWLIIANVVVIGGALVAAVFNALVTIRKRKV